MDNSLSLSISLSSGPFPPPTCRSPWLLVLMPPRQQPWWRRLSGPPSTPQRTQRSSVLFSALRPAWSSMLILSPTTSRRGGLWRLSLPMPCLCVLHAALCAGSASTTFPHTFTHFPTRPPSPLYQSAPRHATPPSCRTSFMCSRC